MEILLAMQPAGGQGAGGGLMSTLILFGALGLIMYFMMIRPQQKRQKQREAMLNALQKGDKVITSGGMHGTVAGLTEKTILVDVGNNIKITFERSAVSIINNNKAPENVK